MMFFGTFYIRHASSFSSSPVPLFFYASIFKSLLPRPTSNGQRRSPSMKHHNKMILRFVVVCHFNTIYPVHIECLYSVTGKTVLQYIFNIVMLDGRQDDQST